MKNKIKRCAAILIAAVLAISLYPSANALDDGERIYISSADDLVFLAERCSTDTWSRGKTVVLSRDISLSGTDYAPIPTFGGTFDGGGHTISGLKLSGSLSPAGLFGEIQEGAVVKNLRVSGTVEPSGKGDRVGGVVGCNRGIVENCVFSGTVTGGNSVGAVAGVNESTGTIRNCTAEGGITGKSMTGGIAGNNRGVIASCLNESYVNITSVDPGINLTDMDVSLSGELLTLRAMDTFNVATDTGGVAGYSSGMVLSCTNSGIVGYPRIGYNVGGIAGRSCGFISGCTNRGQIFGRKDIGGIVGQAEPYILMNLTEDKLQRIEDELDRLELMVNRAADDAEGISGDIHDRFSAIGESAGDASRYVRMLKDQLSDYGDDVLTEIDRGSDLLADTLDRLADIAKDAPTFSSQLTVGLNQLADAVDKLSEVNGFTAEALGEMRKAEDDLSTAADLIDLSISQIAGGLDELSRAVIIEDEAAVQAALDDISAGVASLNTAMGRVGSAMDGLTAAMHELSGIVESGGWGSAGEAVTELLGAAEELSAASSDAAAALETIGQGIAAIQENTVLDITRLRSGLNRITQGLSTLRNAAAAGGNAVTHFRNALALGENASGLLKTAMETFGDAAESFSSASSTGTVMLRKTEELLDCLAAAEPIRVPRPDGETDTSVNGLLSSLDRIGSQMNMLNDAANAAAGTMANDIRGISSQFGAVMNAAIDAIYEAETTSPDDIFSDTSGADIDAVTSGKIFSCCNEAAISGDISVGGVAGTMAVEYELDPEGDLLSDSPVYRREYEFKVILQSCVNNGAVNGRRDYAGGLCGRMDLGLAVGCGSYGAVESESGDYVGGAAGLASGTVRDCWVKCALRGGKYVGGVAGFVSKSGAALQCRSLVRITDYEQYVGAIAGASEGTLKDDLFVADGLAGVNQISTTGKAEPVTYSELLRTEGLPEKFRRFTLRFVAEGELVKEVSFHYGASFDHSVYPEIPPKEGHFARWDTGTLEELHFDTDVTAVYTRYISVLESENKRDNGRPVFFAEGSFSEGDTISAKLRDESIGETEELSGMTGTGIRTILERWSLEIPEDGQETHSLRYLSPNGENERIEIYSLSNGTWQALKTINYGSYLAFQVDGLIPELAVVYCQPVWWVWLGAGVGVLGIAFLALKLVKRYRRKKTVACEAEETENGKTTACGAEKTASVKPVRKKRAKRLAALGCVIVLAAGSFAVYSNVSGLQDGLTAYRLLRKAWSRDGVSMELGVQADAGGKQINLVTQITRTVINGQTVTYARQYGSGIYYSNGLVYLENGCILTQRESLPDYSALTDSIETLYKEADISVFKSGDGNIYSAALPDDTATELLNRLIPASVVQGEKLKDLRVELVERDGKLSELNFASGIVPGDDSGPVSVFARLKILEGTETPEIPDAVREAILGGETKESRISDGELLRLLTAWVKLNAWEPLEARLSLDGGCGPLMLNDTMELYRTNTDGIQITCIRKNGRSVFVSGGRACNEAGETVTSEERKLISTGELLEIAYRICMSGELSCTCRGDEYVYLLELGEEEIAEIVYSVLPEAQELGAELGGGSIQIVLEDDLLQSLRFRCGGTVSILSARTPLSLDGEFLFDTEGGETEFDVPEKVLQAFTRNKTR